MESLLPLDVDQVRYTGANGVAILYQAERISPDRLCAPDDVLLHATMPSKIPIYFEDRNVGYGYALAYQRERHSLCVWFRLTDENVPRACDVVLLPGLNPCGIRCGICHELFLLGSEPCGCIAKAPCIVLEKIELTHLTFSAFGENNPNRSDLRRAVMDAHFINAVDTLWLD